MIEYVNLFEDTALRLPSTVDSYSSNNFFLTRPRGIVLQDTYNNPFFPIRPLPQIDTSKSNFDLILLRYHELYTTTKTDMLPWHYLVEMVGHKYRVYQTRPLNMKFPLSHNDAKLRNGHLLEYNVPWDEKTQKYMENPAFLLEDGISVAIVGDTSTDIYSRNIYNAIGMFCYRPNLYWFKMTKSDQYQVELNIGNRFHSKYMTRFLHK